MSKTTRTYDVKTKQQMDAIVASCADGDGHIVKITSNRDRPSRHPTTEVFLQDDGTEMEFPILLEMELAREPDQIDKWVREVLLRDGIKPKKDVPGRI